MAETELVLSAISGAKLMDLEFMPQEFVVRGLLPKGLSILGGAPNNLLFETATGTLATNPEEEILLYIKKHPDMSLIIIDTFQMVRGNKGDPSYSDLLQFHVKSG